MLHSSSPTSNTNTYLAEITSMTAKPNSYADIVDKLWISDDGRTLGREDADGMVTWACH